MHTTKSVGVVAPCGGRDVDAYLSELQLINVNLMAAKREGDDRAVAALWERLQDAAQTAADAGVGWSAIGKALNLCRGNAYQRLRRRPRETPRLDVASSADDDARAPSSEISTYLDAATLLAQARSVRLRAKRIRDRSVRVREQARVLRDERRRSSGCILVAE